jgi:hypothetical protein
MPLRPRSAAYHRCASHPIRSRKSEIRFERSKKRRARARPRRGNAGAFIKSEIRNSVRVFRGNTAELCEGDGPQEEDDQQGDTGITLRRKDNAQAESAANHQQDNCCRKELHETTVFLCSFGFQALSSRTNLRQAAHSHPQMTQMDAESGPGRAVCGWRRRVALRSRRVVRDRELDCKGVGRWSSLHNSSFSLPTRLPPTAPTTPCPRLRAVPSATPASERIRQSGPGPCNPEQKSVRTSYHDNQALIQGPGGVASVRPP